ncbi:flagellar hook-length control protein FliK [Acidithiobacillus sp. IBUN Pt1247-S3]|uniref:flagellar hook-length control protein FliK n=1 Tax=Acidithiobacillus sp. IBUN Pt1247-S3 TaxID=3166642 RepID=UPI0034E3D64D
MSTTAPGNLLDQLTAVQGRALPGSGAGGGNFSSLIAAGTLVSGQIVGHSGEQSLVRVRGQDFLMQLPERWPSNVRQLSLVYLGGQDQAKFLLLRPQEAQASRDSNLSLLTRTIFASAEGRAPATLSLLSLDASGQISGGSLASALQSRVEGSGMFYESHLHAWVQGNYPLQRLLQEPQGKLSALLSSNAVSKETPSLFSTNTVMVRSWQGEQALGMYSQIAAQGSPPLTVPAALQTLVQQQGQALLQQQMIWTVAVWPGQSALWTVSRRDADARNKQHAADELERWDSRLEVDLPSLGHLDARLRLQGETLGLRLRVAPQAVAALQSAVEKLQTAFAAHGLQSNIIVEPENERSTRPE